jgi:hypothetical protein
MLCALIAASVKGHSIGILTGPDGMLPYQFIKQILLLDCLKTVIPNQKPAWR